MSCTWSKTFIQKSGIQYNVNECIIIEENIRSKVRNRIRNRIGNRRDGGDDDDEDGMMMMRGMKNDDYEEGMITMWRG